MANLFIDDVRNVPDGWEVARTSAEAIAMIRANPPYYWISFDHDLGMLRDGSIDEVRKVIKELWLHGVEHDKLPEQFSVHSDNPEGVKWILGTMENISKHVRPVNRVYKPKIPYRK